MTGQYRKMWLRWYTSPQNNSTTVSITSVKWFLSSCRLLHDFMMTSSNGNIFRVTGHLCGNSPHNGQWRGALMLSLIFARITGWVNNGEAGDLRRHRAHYDVTVMYMRSCKNIRLSYIVISSSSTFKFQPPWWNHYQHMNFDAWKFWQWTLSWT